MIAIPRPRFAARPARAAAGRRRSARAAVLTALAAVAALHAWLAVQVEAVRPEWRDPEFFHRLHALDALAAWRDRDAPGRELGVVLGGSRPQMGLSPAHLGLADGWTGPLAFNCSQSGAVPTTEKLNLDRLLAAGVRPDFVLMEVLPPLLADDTPAEHCTPLPRLGAADLARLRPYHADPAAARAGWAATRAASWSSLRVPLLAGWGLADDFPPGPHRSDFLWRGMDPFGWSPFYPGEWPAARRAAGLAAAAPKYRPLLTDFRVRPACDRVYRDMLGECRGRGIPAALFLMPESPAFRAWYPPAARERLAAFLAALSRDTGAPVFDCSAWLDDETLFMDGHHLLGPGAAAFSERFGRECVSPWRAAGR